MKKTDRMLAEKMLDISAVKLQPELPFVWGNGWNSPVYNDNRRILSYPDVRNFVKVEIARYILEYYSQADVIAAVSTAAIPFGMLAADTLGLPFVYVRSTPKDHGLENMIEGDLKLGQNVVMVAVRDKETRDKLSKMNAAVMGAQNDPFYGAPCVIVVLGDAETYPVVENGSLVLGNLMNAAHAVGLGSCWIHRAQQMFASDEGKTLLRKWGLREDLKGVGNCILGYAQTIPECRPRREGRIVKI